MWLFYACDDSLRLSATDEKSIKNSFTYQLQPDSFD